MDNQILLTQIVNIVSFCYCSFLAANLIAGLAERWVVSSEQVINRFEIGKFIDYFPEPNDVDTNYWATEEDIFIISTESSRDYECNSSYDGWRFIEPESRDYENEYLEFLTEQPIRTLKKLASARQIKHYSTMTKRDLVEEINYWRTMH